MAVAGVDWELSGAVAELVLGWGCFLALIKNRQAYRGPGWRVGSRQATAAPNGTCQHPSGGDQTQQREPRATPGSWTCCGKKRGMLCLLLIPHDMDMTSFTRCELNTPSTLYGYSDVPVLKEHPSIARAVDESK